MCYKIRPRTSTSINVRFKCALGHLLHTMAVDFFIFTFRYIPMFVNRRDRLGGTNWWQWSQTNKHKPTSIWKLKKLIWVAEVSSSRLGRTIHAPPHLSEVSQCSCSLFWDCFSVCLIENGSVSSLRVDYQPLLQSAPLSSPGNPWYESLPSWEEAMSQAPQHVWASKTQATCDGKIVLPAKNICLLVMIGYRDTYPDFV